MLISKTSRYALQAATVLAAQPDRPVRARELAEATGVPRNYLSKVLHQLARHGVLLSERGALGGFRLAVDPSELSLAAIIEPVDPGLFEQKCLLGQAACSDKKACLAHERWKTVSENLRRFLDETTLEEVGKRNVRKAAGRRRSRT